MHVSSCRSRLSFAGFTIVCRLRFEVAAFDRLDVRLSRPMTALTIDARRQRISEARTLAIVFYRRAWVAVVARHASRVDDASEVEMRRAVVPRAHRPITAALGVPADRQLNQAAVRGAMQERPRVIPGSDDVVRLELEHIGFFPAEAGLMASLIDLSVPLNHRVVPVRRLVIHAIARIEFGAADSWKMRGPCP